MRRNDGQGCASRLAVRIFRRSRTVSQKSATRTLLEHYGRMTFIVCIVYKP